MNMNLIMLIGLVLPIVSDWKAIAFDCQRTGRTSAVGQIQTPRLTWKVDISAQDVLATVTPSREDSTLELLPPKQLAPLSEHASGRVRQEHARGCRRYRREADINVLSMWFSRRCGSCATNDIGRRGSSIKIDCGTDVNDTPTLD